MKPNDRGKEPVFPKLDGNFYREARERAKRRRSPANLLLVPLVLGGLVLIENLQLKLLWAVNVHFYPGHAAQFVDFLALFWSQHQSGPWFLMVGPTTFSSLILAMMSANLVLWCVKPVRRIFEKEAEGVPFASFRAAMTGLGYVALYLTPIALVLGAWGAYLLKVVQ